MDWVKRKRQEMIPNVLESYLNQLFFHQIIPLVNEAEVTESHNFPSFVGQYKNRELSEWMGYVGSMEGFYSSFSPSIFHAISFTVSRIVMVGISGQKPIKLSRHLNLLPRVYDFCSQRHIPKIHSHVVVRMWMEGLRKWNNEMPNYRSNDARWHGKDMVVGG